MNRNPDFERWVHARDEDTDWETISPTDMMQMAWEAATERHLGYATQLTMHLWERYYKEEAPEFKPLDDLMGVLSQIDNMLGGLAERVKKVSEIWHPIATAPTDWDILVWNPATGVYRTRAKIEGGRVIFPMPHWGFPGTWYPVPSHWAEVNAVKPPLPPHWVEVNAVKPDSV